MRLGKVRLGKVRLGFATLCLREGFAPEGSSRVRVQGEQERGEVRLS